MLNFDEELDKFKPSMEVDDIEESLFRPILSEVKAAREESAEESRDEIDG